ncbi:MAG: hypothetical protein U1E24_00945 [Phenylobacterium sp.]|jgi:hypothetical protein|nr:hypothetical protein [Phenylobacterium sp.]MDZ4051819.1 hypothetical protein [Phenylobacterium sp.]
MTTSPYVEVALRLLAPNARPWENPTHCRIVVEHLRADGENDLADRLEQAAVRPEGWLGGTTVSL